MNFYFQVSQSILEPNHSKKQGGSPFSILPTLEQKEPQQTNQKSFDSKKFSIFRLGEVFSDIKKELRSKSQNLTHPLTSMTLQDPNILIAEKIPNNTKQRTYVFNIL